MKSTAELTKFSPPLPLRPNLENTYEYMGLLLSFLLPETSSQGRVSIIQGIARAGTEPPPHVHLNEHETYVVEEGRVEFFLEGNEDGVLAEVGDIVFLPCERAHALKYHTDRVKMLMFLEAVDGRQIRTEQFFRQMARKRATSLEELPSMVPYAELDQETLSKIATTAKEAGIVFLADADIHKRLPQFAKPHVSARTKN